MKRILIVYGNAAHRLAKREILARWYQVFEAGSGKEGISQALTCKPDLVLLEQMLPDCTGPAVCERLRALPETRALPIILVADGGAEEVPVEGLELGADDFISRPVHPEELLARVRARLRRKEIDRRASAPIQAGNLRIVPRSYEVFVDERQVRLTLVEFDLLRYFLERPNQAIQRDQFLSDLWTDTIVTDRTVDTHVAHLRRKLQGFNCLLTTVYKVGYMLKVDERRERTIESGP